MLTPAGYYANYKNISHATRVSPSMDVHICCPVSSMVIIAQLSEPAACPHTREQTELLVSLGFYLSTGCNMLLLHCVMELLVKTDKTRCVGSKSNNQDTFAAICCFHQRRFSTPRTHPSYRNRSCRSFEDSRGHMKLGQRSHC